MQDDALARLDLAGPALAQALGEERWLDVTAELVVGGHSNLTYLLRSPAGELILRRPPSGSILATAHDMARESRVQKALGPSAVPVPEIVLEGRLDDVPYYVMTKVPGVVIRNQVPFTADGRARLGEALADVLADLHLVDPQSVGLEDFGRPEGFTARQIRRWRKQIEATPVPAIPALDLLASRLEQSVPPAGRASIVHGDYRLDNVIVSEEQPGRINGVLDWEMSTLGDPLTDVGMLMFYWDLASRFGVSMASSATTLPGFPSALQIAERWSSRTGIGLDRLDWYLAFAHYKFAGIVLGIQARAEAGVMAGQEFGDLGALASGLADAGLAGFPR
ncbi:phosphotransferase family protein [Kineosporia babensis]|uniref:Phosphotransferase family protein n=1 Tax=Kineosporia babensis TaxID=499548 RepID=A0A9X1NI73_9ACTN|nr:phosphotransferase family protein [Kineosporia babensis]MCD5314029.1 phosphotransferase family protein [Kineosporia babensis]